MHFSLVCRLDNYKGVLCRYLGINTYYSFSQQIGDNSGDRTAIGNVQQRDTTPEILTNTIEVLGLSERGEIKLQNHTKAITPMETEYASETESESVQEVSDDEKVASEVNTINC